MNTQTITIEVPEGKVAKQVTNPDGSITISYVDKEPVRSKSWKEFCKNHRDSLKEESYIDTYGIIQSCKVRGRNFANWLATKEDAEGILALIQLTRLHDEWVEGSDYKKYQDKAHIYMSVNGTIPSIGVGVQYHLLDFPSTKMAYEFLECFNDLIEKAKKFL